MIQLPLSSSSKTFVSFQNKPSYTLRSCPRFLFLPWKWPICFLCPQVCLFWLLYRNGIIQRVNFCVWLLSIVFSNYPHYSMNQHLKHFIAEWYSFLLIDSWCIHRFLDGRLGYYHLVFVNSETKMRGKLHEMPPTGDSREQMGGSLTQNVFNSFLRVSEFLTSFDNLK